MVGRIMADRIKITASRLLPVPPKVAVIHGTTTIRPKKP